MISRDTHPEARREQLRLLHEASPARRFAATCSLTQAVRDLARSRLRARMPEADDHAINCALARELYGETLVRQLGIDASDS